MEYDFYTDYAFVLNTLVDVELEKNPRCNIKEARYQTYIEARLFSKYESG